MSYRRASSLSIKASTLLALGLPLSTKVTRLPLTPPSHRRATDWLAFKYFSARGDKSSSRGSVPAPSVLLIDYSPSESQLLEVNLDLYCCIQRSQRPRQRQRFVQARLVAAGWIHGRSDPDHFFSERESTQRSNAAGRGHANLRCSGLDHAHQFQDSRWRKVLLGDLDGEGFKSVLNRRRQSCWGGDGTTLPNAPEVDRVCGGTLEMFDFDGWYVCRCRQKVVGHRGRQTLAFLAVDAALEQNRADSLGHAPPFLAVADCRIDQGPAGLHDEIPIDLDLPCLSIDFHPAAMC